MEKKEEEEEEEKQEYHLSVETSHPEKGHSSNGGTQPEKGHPEENGECRSGCLMRARGTRRVCTENGGGKFYELWISPFLFACTHVLVYYVQGCHAANETSVELCDDAEICLGSERPSAKDWAGQLCRRRAR